MADEKNRSDFEDPKVDADPLNDLVRLLNEEDPFSNFSANRSRDFYNDGGEATRRQEPQQVEMAAPASEDFYGDDGYADDTSYSDEPLISEETSWEEEPSTSEPAYQEPAFQNTQYAPVAEDVSDLEQLEADLADSLRSSLEAYAPQQPAVIDETGYNEPDFESAEDDGWFEANEPRLASDEPMEESPLYADGDYPEQEAYASADEDLVNARLGYVSTDYVDPLYGASEAAAQAPIAEPYSDDLGAPVAYEYNEEAETYENELSNLHYPEEALEEQSEDQDFTAQSEPQEAQVYAEVADTYEDDLTLEPELTQEDLQQDEAPLASDSADRDYDPLALDDIFSQSLSDEIQSNLRGSADALDDAQEPLLNDAALEEATEDNSFSSLEAGSEAFLEEGAEPLLADDNEAEAGYAQAPLSESGIFTEDSFAAGMAAAAAAGLNPKRDEVPTETIASEPPSLATDFDDDYVATSEEEYGEAELNEPSYQEEDYAPQQKQGSKLKFAALAAAVVAAAGAGYFIFSGNSGSGADQAPVVIKADEGQIKTNIAENTTPAGAPSTDQKLIYDRVSGNQTKPQERIQPRQEEVLPVETVPVTPPQAIDAGSTVVGTPRRVQSVTIKPDGTITRAPAPQPQVPNLAVTPPQQPATANGVRVITANPSSAPAAAVEVPGRETVAAPSTPTTPAAPPVAPTQQSQNTQVTETAPINLRPTPTEPTPVEPAQPETQNTESASEPTTPPIVLGSAPVPQKRPGLGTVAAQRPAVNLQTPVSIGGAPQVDGRAALEQAQAAQAQTQAELRPTTQVASNSNSGGFVVQLSAQRSQEEALRSFQALQNRFPQLLSGQEANIQRADLGARGVYYRLGVGPIASRDQASQLCNQLKTSGLPDCFVRAN